MPHRGFDAVGLPEPPRLGPREQEVVIVHQRVLDAGAEEGVRKLGLPDPLRDPGAPRSHAETRSEICGHAVELTLLVPGRNDREDGLVEGAGEKLHLPAGDERAQRVEKRAIVRFQPFQKGPRPVHGEAHAGVARQGFQEGTVGPLDGIGEDRVEVPDRLVVVDRDRDPHGCVRARAHGVP